MADRSPSPSSWEVRSKVFQHSYGEVLAFLKHEDDKIGRVLTALSFLTAAGVALFVFQGHAHDPLRLDGTLDAADFLFAGFTVSLVLALLAILAALDPTSQTPRFLARPSGRQSILFYHSIYERRGWSALNADPGYLEEALAESFHQDTEELARRAEHKVQRFADARVFVHLAVVMLALLGIARSDALSATTRWWLMVSVLGLIGLLAPGWDIYWQRHHGFAGLAAVTRRSLLSIGLLYSLPALFAVALLVTADFTSSWRPQLVSLVFALGALLFSRLALPYLRAPMRLGCGSGLVVLPGLGLLVWFWIG